MELARALKEVYAGGTPELLQENCVLRYRLPKDSKESAGIDAFRFPEGRSVSLQKEIWSLVSLSPGGAAAAETLLELHDSLNSPADRARLGPAASSPLYYMLCDDEELGVTPQGDPDGDLKIRRRCLSWSLFTGWCEGCGIFVEAVGQRPGGEPLGAAFYYPPGAPKKCLYKVEGVEGSHTPLEEGEARELLILADAAFS